MNNSNFTTNKGEYPTIFKFYTLMDCQPNNDQASYTMIDHSDDEDYLDLNGDDQALEIHIPNRKALFELIIDITNEIRNEITGYQAINSTPGDDATNDINMAIDCLFTLSNWDCI